MPISRAQMAKELVPGLHALFGISYGELKDEWSHIFETATSERAYEEEQKLGGFGAAPVKTEGAAIAYDTAQEAWTARYTHETVAMGYSITMEAFQDNLYISPAKRYTKALARAMKETKEVKCITILNKAFTSGFTGGDGVVLCSTAHPLISGGTNSNRPTTGIDLSETAIENAIIQVGGWTDERGLLINAKIKKLVIPRDYQFTATRLLNTVLRTGTADNDVNAINSMSSIPDGFCVNNRLIDTNAWFLTTDVPDGLKLFKRMGVEFSDEGDFDTGNKKFKAMERYSAGFSDPLAIFGSPGVS